MLEVVLKLSSPLDPGVTDLTDFGGVELIPLSMMELEVKFVDEFGVNKIQERIADITVILN